MTLEQIIAARAAADANKPKLPERYNGTECIDKDDCGTVSLTVLDRNVRVCAKRGGCEQYALLSPKSLRALRDAMTRVLGDEPEPHEPLDREALGKLLRHSAYPKNRIDWDELEESIKEDYRRGAEAVAKAVLAGRAVENQHPTELTTTQRNAVLYNSFFGMQDGCVRCLHTHKLLYDKPAEHRTPEQIIAMWPKWQRDIAEQVLRPSPQEREEATAEKAHPVVNYYVEPLTPREKLDQHGHVEAGTQVCITRPAQSPMPEPQVVKCPACGERMLPKGVNGRTWHFCDSCGLFGPFDTPGQPGSGIARLTRIVEERDRLRKTARLIISGLDAQTHLTYSTVHWVRELCNKALESKP